MRKVICMLMSLLLVLCSIPTVSASTPSETSVFNKAYIPISNGSQVDVLDLISGTIETSKITVGSVPMCSAINPNGTQVFVSNFSSHTISVINPLNDTVTATISGISYGPTGIIFNSTGSKAYVVSRNASKLSIIDTTSLTVTKIVATSAQPTASTMVGNKIYIACETGNSIDIFDMDTETITSSISVNIPLGITSNPAKTKVYALGNINNVYVINVADNTVTTINTGHRSQSCEVSPDGSKLYVASVTTNSVTVINTADNSILTTIDVGSHQVAVGITPDGSKLIVVRNDSKVSIVDLSTNIVTNTLSLSGAPQFIFGSFMVPVSVTATLPSSTPSTVTVSDSTKAGIYNSAVNFSASDFTYSDIKNAEYSSQLSSSNFLNSTYSDTTTEASINLLKINTLPSNGTLKVGTAAATINQEITGSDISTLSFTPNVDWSGSTSFRWNVNTGTSYAANDASMTINIASGNNNLNGLSISSGTLSPVFDPAVTSYTASVPNSTTGASITAISTTGTSITIDGISATSGVTSSAISLKVGSNTINVTITAEDGTSKSYVILVTRAEEPVVPVVPAVTSSSSVAPPSTGADILVNGKVQSAGSKKTETVAGKSITTITVDATKLDALLASEGNNALVTLLSTSKSDAFIGMLTGQMIKSMESKLATLEIKSETASYKLPAKQIDIDATSKQLGESIKLSDIKVTIEISKPSADTVKIVEDSFKKGNLTIVATPVEFTVKCEYAGKTVDVLTFNDYVERSLLIPDGVDTSKITTGVVIDEDGTIRHIPTKIIKDNGKYYAKLNSLTNSTYSVVYNSVEFSDVSTHWAKDTINDMGSRLIASGISNGNFEPARDITRAEFAEIVVKGLGLKIGSGGNPFSDVKSSDYFANSIKTAADYKLISGYTDGTFKPNDKISRQEAMVIIAKAMKLTSLNSGVTEKDIANILAKYSDNNKISTWARAAAAECVKTGIISGISADVISPIANITRAEVTVIIKSLLQKSNLI